MITIDKNLIDRLFAEAEKSPRLRMNYDLRDSELDGSQRMLNALLPKTQLPIHRHNKTSETVVVICGSMDEIFYEENGKETERIHLEPAQANYGCQIPKGVWHSIEVFEPTVIIEAKEGRYGEDGSEQYKPKSSEAQQPAEKFENCLGGLKKNIEYLIGMERHSGSMEVITPLYVSRMLNVPLADVEAAMKDMDL